MTSIARRQFLTSAALLATAPFVRAIQPFDRPSPARLKLSLAAYSFRDHFADQPGGKPGSRSATRPMDLFGFVDFCAAQGCDGAELTAYYFPKAVEPDFLLRLRRHAFVRGVGISGTAIGNTFSHPRGEKRDTEIRLTKQWIDRAAVLGAPHIRVFAGVTKEIPRAEADKLVISALEECGEYAGRKGIFLGLENHDSISTSAALLEMVRAVANPWVGINLDSGNFKSADPYRDFAACVPHAVNVQFKTEIQIGGQRVAADLPRLTKLLRDGGYQGWVALEYEAKEDPATAVPRLLAEMKGLFAA